MTTTTNYLGGMAVLQRLPALLSTNEVAALRGFLAAPYDPAGGLTPREFNAVKNAAADLLLAQPDVPPDLVADFALQYLDGAYDPVWRDYCLQFLSTGHERLSGCDDPDAVACRAAALEVLRAATAERVETFAGTALLGLDAIARRDPVSVPPADVGALAVAVATDSGASGSCRVTALRLAAMHGAAEVLPAARELVRTGATELLRQAAVTTLGDLGTPQDEPLLVALSQGNDAHVAVVAARAADALRRRLAAGTGHGQVSTP